MQYWVVSNKSGSENLSSREGNVFILLVFSFNNPQFHFQ